MTIAGFFWGGASPLFAPETANQREKSTGKTYQPERPLAIKKAVGWEDCEKLSGPSVSMPETT